jgi:beta-mannanase
MKAKVLAAVISIGALMLSENVLATNSRLAIPDPGSATAQTPSDKRPIIAPDSIVFGAYDPHGDFTEDPNSRIEHLFLPWEDVDLSSLAIADEYAQQRGRSLLITVEPWSWSREWRVTSQELLKTILSGQRDKYMAAVCSEADKLKSPVTIRWAQEMDEADNQFIWAHWKPEEYVAAYRRMVTVCRQNLGNAKYMWSPKGNEGLEAFYPGAEFVDEIGLSIFGYQPYDQGVVGHDTTFAEQLAAKYDRVKGFGKPIVVAELGYDGDHAYVTDWAENVAKSRPEFPDLTAIVYFNDREVYPWPDGYGLPHWRVVQQLQN